MGAGPESPPINKKQVRLRGPASISSFFLIQSGKELVITALINLTQFNKDADTNVQFSGFVLGVGRSTNITSTALKFGTEFLL